MSEQIPSEPLELAHRIADCFRSFGAVQAVAVGETDRDLDLYVFTTEPISLQDRDRIADRNDATQREPARSDQIRCDEWIDAESGAAIDLTYWDPAWVEQQIDRVLERHEASLGYTTTFWNTILRSQILYDKNGWLTALKTRCSRPYPDELRAQIIARNHAVLRGPPPSYADQIEKAVRRNDPVSVQHRITALLASYFDVLFALNRLPHPGERRLLENAARLDKQPAEMEADVRALIQSCRQPGEEVLTDLQRLLDRLDALLIEEGIDPETSQPAG